MIEAKRVRDTPYPKQAILDDLLRLECFRDPTRHVFRYFLVGGLEKHLEQNFFGVRYRDSGTNSFFMGELLDQALNQGTKTIDVFAITGALQKFYRKFETDYGVSVPKKFKTTLLDKESGDDIAVYLWQIESVKNRTIFSPTSDW